MRCTSITACARASNHIVQPLSGLPLPCSVMRLVLNPDNAPLSPPESAQMEELLETYMAKQGFAVPGAAPRVNSPQSRRPVNLDLLHSWPTVFFLRDAAPTLRATRQEALAAAAAAEEAARVAAEQKRSEDAAAASKAAAAAAATLARDGPAPTRVLGQAGGSGSFAAVGGGEGTPDAAAAAAAAARSGIGAGPAVGLAAPDLDLEAIHAAARERAAAEAAAAAQAAAAAAGEPIADVDPLAAVLGVSGEAAGAEALAKAQAQGQAKGSATRRADEL